MPDAPSPFVSAWLPVIASEVGVGRAALDVAMGSGRHAIAMAAQGFRAFGVDIAFDRVQAAKEEGRRRGLTIRGWVADLTATSLPERRFDLVVCTRYLQRDLFVALERILTPGGFLLFETFTTLQPRHGWGPTSSDHLLRPGELRDAFTELTVLSYEEAEQPAALARLVARR